MTFYYVGSIIFILLIIILSSPKVKGIIGEKSVRIKLKKLDKQKYMVLNDIMIPNKKGNTSQIDHIIVSVYGIFVIETKNYKGWIVGSEKSYQWKQVIYKRKEKFLNPILQNKGHIQSLQLLLKDFPNIVYHPIVTFGERADLKVNTTSDVVYTPKLLKTIKKYQVENLTIQETKQIYDIILKANITDRKLKKEHIKTIKTNINDRDTKIKNNICPLCGGQLVKRKGKYGEFIGCSNYPKCRFIKK